MNEREGPLSFGDEDEPRRPREPESPSAAPAADVPPPARPPTRRYGWLVGVIGLLVIAYITLNTLRTQSREAPQGGKPLPPFATPLALGPLNGDANVARKADSGPSGRRPASTSAKAMLIASCSRRWRMWRPAGTSSLDHTSSVAWKVNIARAQRR